MFIDEVKVYAKAGHGGKGCVAFLREAYRPKGGPSGGNGGHGGDVILEANHDLNNLIAQFYNPRLIAEKGGHGLGKGMDGKAGKDMLVPVPCGTLIWRLPPKPQQLEIQPEDVIAEQAEKGTPSTVAADLEHATIRIKGGEQAVEVDLTDTDDQSDSSEASEKEGAELVADLTEHGQRFFLCKGGRGGLGNRNFATSRRQTPRFAQPGEPGDEGDFIFELRIMAEVGLVGYPNAGKSTLLTAISRARPKIAAYPFTTLHPQVGIMEYTDFKRLTICDVPGLIEGAHNNVGLGHKFLRHIRRCKVLVLLLDMAGVDGRHPWDDYHQLLVELELYDPEFLNKPRLVVANKIDEPDFADNLKKFKRRVPKTPVLGISAGFDIGMDKFKQVIRDAVEKG